MKISRLRTLKCRCARLPSLTCFRIFFYLLVLLKAPAAFSAIESAPEKADVQDGSNTQAAPGTLTKAPELIESVDAEYPAKAFEEGRESAVTLILTIGVEGQVEDVKIEVSGGDDFDQAALRAVRQFKFSPAEIDGKPARVQISFTQNFTLDVVKQQRASEEEGLIDESFIDELDESDFQDFEGLDDDGFFEDESDELNLNTNNPSKAIEATPKNVAKNGEKKIRKRGPVNFVGVVRQSSKKTPLAGVEVSIEILPKGYEDAEDLPEGIKAEVRYATSDELGRFYFRALPSGNHMVTYAASGFQTSFTFEEISDGQRSEVVVYLKARELNTFETVTRARPAKKEVAKITLSREEVRKVPGTFGDPIRVIENLPGLARAPFAGGALIVRGANPQNTGVYFDSVLIPLIYHFGGLKSIVNPEFLENLNFYPGGFGAKYGFATAGIVDVDSRELKMENYRGYADISLLDAGFFFGGPLKIKGLPDMNFGIAARRSYVDAIIPVFIDALTSGGVVATPVYWDYQAKLEMPLKKHQLSLFVFGSEDDLKVIAPTGQNSIDLGLRTTFHRVVPKITSKLKKNLTHTFQPYFGVTSIGLNTDSNLGISGNLQSNTYSWGIRDELRSKINDNVELALGFDYLGNTLGFAFDFPFSTEFGSFPRVYPRLVGENFSLRNDGTVHGTALYLEGVLKPTSRLQLNPSLRLQHVFVDLAEVENLDGTTIPANQITYLNADPRISARYKLSDETTLKGAFGIYRQPAQGFELLESVGNPELNQLRAFQSIIGLEHRLSKYISIDLQAYYTKRDNNVRATSDSVTEADGTIRNLNFTNQGLGSTIGAELLLRHDMSKYFFGWLAYTLSRSVENGNRLDSRLRNTNFDQTHILTLVAQGKLPWGLSLGGRFRLVSGNPATRAAGSIHDLDTTDYVARFQPINSSRAPAFHQLDIRLDKTFVFDTFKITPYLDLLNIYNRMNAEFYQDDYRFREQSVIPSLPIFPNFGVQGEF